MLIEQNRLRQLERAIRQRPMTAGFGKKSLVKEEPRPFGQFRKVGIEFLLANELKLGIADLGSHSPRTANYSFMSLKAV